MKNVMHLDFDVSNIRQGRCRDERNCNSRSTNGSCLSQVEVIGRLRFFLVRTGTP